MPNRIIKESICASQNLNGISPNAEVLFYRLIVNADDYGRLDARLPIVRAKCFPLKIDSISDDEILSWLNQLVEFQLINIYSVNNQDYLQLLSWEHHQQIRAKRSKYPDPNGKHPRLDDNTCNQMIADDNRCPRNPIQSNPIRILIQSNNIPDFINKELLDDFFEMRKKKRVPLTDRALKLLINKFNEFHSKGLDVNKLIENSIMNGWTSIFEPRGNSNGTNKSNNNQTRQLPKVYTNPEDL